MQLKDAVVVITGANSGLGLALSEALIKGGAQVVMSGRTTDHVEREAKRLGAVAVTADVTDESQIAALADSTVKRFGKIDAWINNAGIWMPYTDFQDVPVARASEIIETNYLGVWRGAQAAYRQMLKQGHGTILNVLSIRVREPVAQTAAYSSSKLAAYGLTQVLRAEAAPHNIHVLAAMPGRIRTNLFDEKKPDNHASFMDPDEVAAKIMTWISQESPDPDLVITTESLAASGE